MKALGKLMMLVGAVLVIMGIVGFYQVNTTGFGGDAVDSLIGLNNMLGSTQYMDSSDRFILWIVQYRKTLLLCGVVAAVVGFFMKNSKSDTQESHEEKPVSEVKEEVQNEAKDPLTNVQKSVIEKPKAESSIEVLEESGEVPLWLSIAAMLLLIVLFIVLK